MYDVAKNLSNQQIQKITNSSYYHLKHYGELPHYDANYYLLKMEYTKNNGYQHLQQIYEEQKQREEQKLSPIFAHDLSNEQLEDLGYSTSNAQILVSTFNQAKTGTIEDKVNFLNLFSSFNLYQPSEENDPLGQVQKTIISCFSNSSNTNKFNGGLEDYEMFISGLIGVFNSLSDYANQHSKDGIIKPMIDTVLKKLKYLIDYYIKEYNIRAQKRASAARNFDSLFSSLEGYLDIKKGRKWSKLLETKGNFDIVSSVLQDSASGFLQQKGGGDYEDFVARKLLQDLGSIFQGMGASANGSAQNTGRSLDRLNKYQKADIKLNFTISGKTSVTNTDFTLSFSIKKSSDTASSIQIHHGGSLFAYANRLSNQGLGLEFLQDGQFQYVFVNEFQKRSGGNTDFVTGFKNVLKAFGYYFLGQEIEEETGGADFLYVSGKIYTFSSILKKALENPEIFEIALRFSSKDSLKQKRALLDEYTEGPYYSDSFIQRSIDIGKESIYGTAFTIKLKKSALNL